MRYIFLYLIGIQLVSCKMAESNQKNQSTEASFMFTFYKDVQRSDISWDSLVRFRPEVFPQQKLINDGHRTYVEEPKWDVLRHITYVFDESSKKIKWIQLDLNDQVNSSQFCQTYFRVNSQTSELIYQQERITFDLHVKGQTVRLAKTDNRQTF